MGVVLRATPEAIARVLLACIAFVVAGGLVARAAILRTAESAHGVRELARRFDLDIEHNIPTWFATLELLAAAVLLAVIALDVARRRARWAWHWAALSVLFVGLSLDEAASLHELVSGTMRGHSEYHGFFFFAWVIPGFALVVALGIAFARFLRDLPARTRGLFMVSGGIYVGAALGMEAVGGMVVEVHGFESLRYSILMLIEETCEFLGAGLFLYALLDYLRATRGSFGLDLSTAQATSR